MKADDRSNWKFSSGFYYFCVKAYDSLSATFKIGGGDFKNKLNAEFDTAYNFFLKNDEAQQFSFSKGELVHYKANFKVEATVYTTGNGYQTDLRIFYKLCTSGSCYLNADEASGAFPKGGDVKILDLSRVMIKTGNKT